MSRRRVAILAGIGVAAIALTLGAVLTRGTDQGTANAAALADMTSYVATTSGSDDGTRADMRSQISDLMANDDFRDGVRALRDKQRDAMEGWWDRYGEDGDSEAAHEAKQTLREEQRTEMNELLSKYGVDTTAMEQAREAAQQAREKIRELMSDDAFRADLSALQDKQRDAMDAWWEKHGEDRDSDAANEAKRTLRENAVSDVEKLAEKYGVELPDGLRGFLGKRGGSMGGGGHMGPRGHRGGGFMPPAEGPYPGAEESAANLSI